MSLVAFVAGRSPGLTTAVHALAAAWPAHRRAIMAEVDPAGGTLAARHELPPEPGLTNLAAAGRRGLNPETVARYCRRLPSGVVALVAPVNPNLVASALAVLGPDLAPSLEWMPGTDVLADCGRVDRRSPAMDVVLGAPYTVVVVTPTLEGVAYAHAALDALSLPAGRLALLTVGHRPYSPDEVGAALGVPVLGALAYDLAGAARFNAGRPAHRSDLLRSASSVASELARALPALGYPTDDAPPAIEPALPAGPGAEPASVPTIHSSRR